MRKIFTGIVITLFIVFCLQYCEHKKDEREVLSANTALIQKQLKNVGKLVVTEGSYAQIFTYEDSKEFYIDVLSAKKKALVVVNAEATISYDLSEVVTEIDDASKTVRIKSIPEPELKINPNIEYYDVQQDYLNQFEARDYNIIKQRVEKGLRTKIEASSLYTNAQNRLISELQKIYILTNSLGWTLEYEGKEINNEKNSFRLKL